jgi:hypothetical protein
MCLCLFCVSVVLCVGRGAVTLLPSIYKIK